MNEVLISLSVPMKRLRNNTKILQGRVNMKYAAQMHKSPRLFKTLPLFGQAGQFPPVYYGHTTFSTNQIIQDYSCLLNMLCFGIEAKASPLFLFHIFANCMEKELCTKFCGNLIIFHKVIKLQSFAFIACESFQCIPTNV